MSSYRGPFSSLSPSDQEDIMSFSPNYVEPPSRGDSLDYGDGWHIYYDPPPIPDRRFDWHFYHDNYDGTQDEGPADWRHGDAASYDACVEEIEALIEENGQP